MLCQQYFHNTFTINFKWLVVIKGGQKDNLNKLWIQKHFSNI